MLNQSPTHSPTHGPTPPIKGLQSLGCSLLLQVMDVRL